MSCTKWSATIDYSFYNYLSKLSTKHSQCIICKVRCDIGRRLQDKHEAKISFLAISKRAFSRTYRLRGPRLSRFLSCFLNWAAGEWKTPLSVLNMQCQTWNATPGQATWPFRLKRDRKRSIPRRPFPNAVASCSDFGSVIRPRHHLLQWTVHYLCAQLAPTLYVSVCLIRSFVQAESAVYVFVSGKKKKKDYM